MIARTNLVMRLCFVPIRLASVPAWTRHLMSYSIIGGACACLSNLIVIASSLAGFRYWNAAALSFVLVTPFGYILQSRITFKAKLSVGRFMRFAGSVAIGAFLFVILLGLFHGICGIPIWIASPLVTMAIFCWNYTASLWTISYFGRAESNAPIPGGHDTIIKRSSIRACLCILFAAICYQIFTGGP